MATPGGCATGVAHAGGGAAPAADAGDPRVWPRRFGARARIGLIVPPSNTTNEAEFACAAPEGVTVHTTRTPLHVDAAAPGFEAELARDADAAVALLAQAAPSVVVYACTVATMLTDETRLASRMAERAGAPAITTSGAILAALAALGARRVALVAPYTTALTAHEADWLGARGVTVTGTASFGLGATMAEFAAICRLPDDEIVALADRAVAAAPCEALLLSCTDLPTFHLIDALEARHGVPVISSNQATLWHALRRAGVGDRLAGLGRLFALS